MLARYLRYSKFSTHNAKKALHRDQRLLSGNSNFRYQPTETFT